MSKNLNFKKLNESLGNSQMPKLHLEVTNSSQLGAVNLNYLEQSLF
jgi:hypothetical protein